MTPDRPDNAPPIDDPLLLAARYNDAEAEDHDLSKVAEGRGLNFESLMYAAEQRAARVVLIQSGRLGEMSRTEPTAITFNPKEQGLLDALVPLYVDAILLGWRAHELKEDT